MKRVLTALVLIPLVLFAVFKAPSWLFTLLVGAVALLALKEYLDLVEAYGVKSIRWLSYALVILIFAAQIWNTAYIFFFDAVVGPYYSLPFYERISSLAMRGIAALWPFLFLSVAMRTDDLSKAFPSAGMSGMSIFYIGYSMLTVAMLQSAGWYALIFTFFAVWAGDIVAMYTGKAIGKHKMSPRISPNKTWEGAIGSVVGSVLACCLLAYFAPRIAASVKGWTNAQPLVAALPKVIIFAILLNIAAQLGDLVESLIKRGANVKDSGTMLPGHGGILDRIDALLFAAPVALILFEFVH
ncbi:MAG TPA: phosphatidate cytidylyltransferase [Candidatus Koribacter sp.]|jgi:phosphatidate cytidylyltransferase